MKQCLLTQLENFRSCWRPSGKPSGPYQRSNAEFEPHHICCNVQRILDDIKLPPAERRNYKHAIDGLIRICKEENFARLFNGASMATGRGILMTIGQISFYEQIKQFLITSNLAKDNLNTHLFSSFLAASGATVLTQPMDVCNFSICQM
jgi:hypothetical protein